MRRSSICTNTFVNYDGAGGSGESVKKKNRIERSENMTWHRSRSSVGGTKVVAQQSRPLARLILRSVVVRFSQIRRRMLGSIRGSRAHTFTRSLGTTHVHGAPCKPALIFHVCAITRGPFWPAERAPIESSRCIMIITFRRCDTGHIPAY